MSKTIWKFELKAGYEGIEMPIGAEILSIKMQNEKPYLWVLVDPAQKKELRYFEVFGTGHDIYYDMGISRKFLGTVLMRNDSLVFHVFERE